MSDPVVVAAQEIFEDSIEDLHDSVSGLPADALNWRPAGDETNPIAVLAVHAMGATHSWLAVAFGAPLPERDRDAEFLTVAEDAPTLVTQVDVQAEACRTLFANADPFEPATMRTSHSRMRSGEFEVVSGAWALLHAVEHLREHVAHALLTRQLWERREA